MPLTPLLLARRFWLEPLPYLWRILQPSSVFLFLLRQLCVWLFHSIVLWLLRDLILFHRHSKCPCRANIISRCRITRVTFWQCLLDKHRECRRSWLELSQADISPGSVPVGCSCRGFQQPYRISFAVLPQRVLGIRGIHHCHSSQAQASPSHRPTS